MSNNVSRPWLVPGLLVVIALAVLALVSLMYRKYIVEDAINHPIAVQRVKEHTKDHLGEPCKLHCKGMQCKVRGANWVSGLCEQREWVFDCSTTPCRYEGVSYAP